MSICLNRYAEDQTFPELTKVSSISVFYRIHGADNSLHSADSFFFDDITINSFILTHKTTNRFIQATTQPRQQALSFQAMGQTTPCIQLTPFPTTSLPTPSFQPTRQQTASFQATTQPRQQALSFQAMGQTTPCIQPTPFPTTSLPTPSFQPTRQQTASFQATTLPTSSFQAMGQTTPSFQATGQTTPSTQPPIDPTPA